MISRRKRLAGLIIALLIGHWCNAQKWRSETDSLLKQYKQASTATQKVNLLAAASLIFLFQNPDTAMILSNEAETIANNSGNDTLKALAYAGKSAVYLMNDNNQMTLEYALRGLKISEHTPLPPDIMASLYRKLGYIYRNTNKGPQGIDAYKKAFAWSAASHNLRDMAGTASNIGNIFNTINQYDSALHYHASALAIAQKGHFSDIILRSYINIINAYNGLKQYPKAFATVQAMLPWLQDADVTPITKGLAYTRIASLDLQHGDYSHQLATRYLDSMRRLMMVTSPGKDNQIDYYLNRALLEFSVKHFDSASASLEKYNDLKKIRDDEIIAGHTQELETRYETGKKEAQIKDLDKQNRLRKNLLVISLTASCIFLAMLFLVLRQNKKIKKQEGHLNYLMKELHHRVKNNLQIVSSLLNLQSAKIADHPFGSAQDAQRALTEGQHRIEAMSLIHQKLYQTKTSSRVNIKEFIAELCESLMHAYGYNNSRFNIQLQITVQELEADMAIPVGLILNEAVTNAFKYAYKEVASPSLTVSLHEDNNKLLLVVTDNGTSLTEKAWKQSASFGRQLMQSLTGQLDGHMQLHCNNGTSFIFAFPLKPVHT
jgi:two-component sensor histidine kinase